MLKYLLLSFSPLFVVLFSHAQEVAPTSDASLNKLITLTQSYHSRRLTEKVHLHLDKPYHAIGDNIYNSDQYIF